MTNPELTPSSTRDADAAARLGVLLYRVRSGSRRPEFAEHAVGFAERMEPDAPGFHRTQTVDYVWVAKGQVVLETDTGEVTFDENDVVVQHGTRHAWRNPRDNSATLSVVLVGVEA
jgi:mannose-6-phosphate isomerase-like protein (cupin superfamily)